METVSDWQIKVANGHSYEHFMRTISEQLNLVQDDIANNADPKVILARLQFAFEYAQAAIKTQADQAKSA